MVLIISNVSGIVNVMCLLIPAAVCLFILGSLGTIIIAQWDQWVPYYKMWKTLYWYVYWKVRTPELLELGDIFLHCWSFK